jgi:hypothetical protein
MPTFYTNRKSISDTGYLSPNLAEQSALGDLAALGSVMRRGGSPGTGIVGSVDITSDPEEFVAKFADFWKNPSPQRLPELFHPDVVLVQPLAPRTVGSRPRKNSSNGSAPASPA